MSERFEAAKKHRRWLALRHTGRSERSVHELSETSHVLAASVALALLTGCGNGGSGGSVIRSGHSFILVNAKVNGPVVGVGWGGTVTMSGHCLGIDGATVIWPHGTKISSSHPLIADVPGIGLVRVGDVVSGGGGEPGPLGALPSGIDAIPSGCPVNRAVYFSAN